MTGKYQKIEQRYNIVQEKVVIKISSIISQLN
jgi:hypothetical protein